MPSTESIRGYACLEKGQPLQVWSYDPKPVGDDDVEIKISNCGICASDIHTLDSGWGPTEYPVIVGHEIVGTVVKRGQNARFQVGDRVGVGAQVLSCMTCSECTNEKDPLCEKRVFTYNSKYEDGWKTYGGYAEAVRVSSQFAFKIPDAIPEDAAAPLLCAGATVYSPLERFKAGPGKKVGVVGIGGLGHLAIQFAAKMGAEVTAVSHSANKKDECMALGAKKFANISDKATFPVGQLDLLLVTSNHHGQPWDLYMSFLQNRGTMVLLAVPEESLSIHPGSFVMREISLSGSLIGSRPVIERMLQFAAEHGVKPVIEKTKMANVNDAIQRVRDGKVRYRMVLEADLQ